MRVHRHDHGAAGRPGEEAGLRALLPARPVHPDLRHRRDAAHQHRPCARRADADRHHPGQLQHPDQPLRRGRLRRASRSSSTPSAACRCGSTLPFATRHTGLDVPASRVPGAQRRAGAAVRSLPPPRVPGRGRRVAIRSHRRPRAHHAAAGVRPPVDRQGRVAGPHEPDHAQRARVGGRRQRPPRRGASTQATCSASARRSRSSTPTTSSASASRRSRCGRPPVRRSSCP